MLLTIIMVNHNQYGNLFTCLLNSSGSLLTPDPDSGIIKEFSTDEVLAELNKFGFDVTFSINQHLSGDQISFLMTVNDLGYDKLRRILVQDKTNHYVEYIVVFNVEKCPDWLDEDYFLEKMENEDRKMNPVKKFWEDFKAVYQMEKKRYFSFETLGTEYNLNVKIDGNSFGGRLDALVKDNNKYYILDYKTGATPKNAKYDFQTIPAFSRETFMWPACLVMV